VTADHAWCESLRTEHQERLPGLGSECEQLTTAPDLSDAEANRRRRELLRLVKGPIIDSIPDDAVWTRVRLSPEDCLWLRLRADRSWWALSDGSLLLRRAAENASDQDWIISGQIVASLGSTLGDVRDEIETIRWKVSRMTTAATNTVIDGLPILIKDATIDSITIIDGCHRMTALLVNTAFFKRDRPEIEAFLGASPRMSSNRWLAR
jgi:hypothetical protein